jgi:hypothetical protein
VGRCRSSYQWVVLLSLIRSLFFTSGRALCSGTANRRCEPEESPSADGSGQASTATGACSVLRIFSLADRAAIDVQSHLRLSHDGSAWYSLTARVQQQLTIDDYWQTKLPHPAHPDQDRRSDRYKVRPGQDHWWRGVWCFDQHQVIISWVAVPNTPREYHTVSDCILQRCGFTTLASYLFKRRNH